MCAFPLPNLFLSRVHVLMSDERRKEERSKQGQTNNKHACEKCTATVLTHAHALLHDDVIMM